MLFRPTSRRSSLGPQQGAALVVALLVFALCTALIVAMKREFTLFYQRGSNIFVAEQGYSYLRGAEDLATLALQVDFDLDNQRGLTRDDLTEFWSADAIPYPIDRFSTVLGELEDLQGRFNLNWLSVPVNNPNPVVPTFTVAQQRFIRLLQALPSVDVGEAEAIAITQAIGDWMDGDSVSTGNGAEDDFYFSQTPPYRAANRLMASVSELRAVANITPEIFAALAPWVSALPSDDTVLNIHTASPMLLRTINEDGNYQPLSEADAQSLFEDRCENTFADVAGFLDNPVFSGKEPANMGDNLGEASEYFLLAAQAEVADRQMRLYSVLERKGRAVRTLARASGSLYIQRERSEIEKCKKEL
ncbi:MAG: type II secretion system minor pseudopilin GspK [Halioglobus sp.]